MKKSRQESIGIKQICIKERTWKKIVQRVAKQGMKEDQEQNKESKTATQGSKSNIITDHDESRDADSSHQNRHNLTDEEDEVGKMSPEVEKKKRTGDKIDRLDDDTDDDDDREDDSVRKFQEIKGVKVTQDESRDEDGDRLSVNVIRTANPIRVNMEIQEDEDVVSQDKKEGEETVKKTTLTAKDSFDAGMSSLTPGGSAKTSIMTSGGSLMSEPSTTSNSASPPTLRYALKQSSKPRLLRQAASVMVEAFDSFAARASSFGLSRGNSREAKDIKDSETTSKDKDSSSSSGHKPRPKLIERLQKSSSEPSPSVSFRSRSFDDQLNTSIEESMDPFLEVEQHRQETENKDATADKVSQDEGNQVEVDTTTSSSSEVNPSLQKRRKSKSEEKNKRSVTTAVIVQTERPSSDDDDTSESVDNRQRRGSKHKKGSKDDKDDKPSKSPPSTPRKLSFLRKNKSRHPRQTTQTTTIETTDESLYQITSLNSTDISLLGDSFSSSTTSDKQHTDDHSTTVMGKLRDHFKSSGLVFHLPYSGRKAKSVEVSSSNLEKDATSSTNEGINEAKGKKKDYSHSSSSLTTNIRETTTSSTVKPQGNSSPVHQGSRSLVSPSSSPQHLNKPSVRAISLTSISGNDNLLAPIIEENNAQPSSELKTSLSNQERETSPLKDVRNTGSDLKDSNQGKSSSNTRQSMKEETFDAENILGIHIHNTDRKLKCAKVVLHPVIKVHVIDIKTGKYLRKKHPRRNVTSYYENHNRISSLEYIIPIMTQPCDLVQYIRYPRAPIWEELLLYNEDYDYFLRNEVIFLFEVKDLLFFACHLQTLLSLVLNTMFWHWLFMISLPFQIKTKDILRSNEKDRSCSTFLGRFLTKSSKVQMLVCVLAIFEE